MVTIACVLKSGGIFDRRWVWALKRGLARHAPSHEFVCLTDVPGLGIWSIPLEHGWTGWWSKIELFRPGLFDGPVLYLDLDTLVVGNLADLVSYDGPFAMLSDFYRPESPASGVMAWTPSAETAAIYESFVQQGRIPGGRSDHWYARHAPKPVRLQDMFPGQIVSFKAHARSTPPEGARLVCGHGLPRFNDRKAGWAHDAWKSLTPPVAA